MADTTSTHHREPPTLAWGEPIDEFERGSCLRDATRSFQRLRGWLAHHARTSSTVTANLDTHADRVRTVQRSAHPTEPVDLLCAGRRRREGRAGARRRLRSRRAARPAWASGQSDQPKAARHA